MLGFDGQPAAPEDELHVAFIRLFRRLKRMTATGGLDPALVGVLHEVTCSAPIRVSVLAETLRLDQSTVSRHVRSLEQLGLVERSGDPDDRRAALLSPTAAGRDQLTAIHSQRRALFRSATAEWSDEDRDHLARLIDRLAQDLDALGSTTVTTVENP
ncbi:MAG: MarR family winged helix-turn-helix transcriptional regulator [Jiangellaceae bacterium]